MATSLPVRERGLKLFPAASWQPPCGSLPVRERGLKQARLAAEAGVVVVAPRAGAWIEAGTGGVQCGG